MAGEELTTPVMAGAAGAAGAAAPDDTAAERAGSMSPKPADMKEENKDVSVDAAPQSEEQGLKRKRSASPDQPDKLAKARAARTFGKKKRVSVSDTSTAGTPKKTEEMSTALPVTKRVAALREPAKRKRSRELAGLGLDGTKGIEEPAKQLPYFIPEEQQGKANRPVCREPGGIKWKELRPVRCKVPVPEGEDERKEKFFVSGFDTVDVLVSNPGEPARYEPALVLDQREGPDDTIYLMVAYWWKRDAVRKALSGFKKYLDRKWPKNEPWQWMLGMYFDVITSDYVHDKVAVDGKFCKTLFFGHIPYNFEIFDREASDESSRQEFIKQKLGTEADRDAMETAMRKLWLLIGPALEDQPEEEGFDEDDIEDPVPIKTDVSEHVGSSISEEVETSNDLPDNGNNDSDSSSVGSTFVVQSKSEKPAAVQDDEKDGPPQLDGNADKKENIKPVAGPIQTPSGTIFINKTVPFSSSYSAAVSREPSWLAEVPKLTKDQQQQLEAVMASIKRLVKMRSVVDQWCKYDLEEPVFEHLKRMIADDPEIDKETFKYDYFSAISEFHGRVVGTIVV